MEIWKFRLAIYETFHSKQGLHDQTSNRVETKATGFAFSTVLGNILLYVIILVVTGVENMMFFHEFFLQYFMF
jgi:hypothetical protein